MLTKNPDLTLRSRTYDGRIIETPADPEVTQTQQAAMHRQKVRDYLVQTMTWRLLPGQSWWEDAA